MTVELQPVHRVTGVIGLELCRVSVIAVCICAERGVPQDSLVGVVYNQAVVEVEAWDSVVVVPGRKFTGSVPPFLWGWDGEG